MSFFEPPPPPPPPEPGPPRPEWTGPPENVIPGSFPLELVVARTDDLALYVQGGQAYPNGWQFGFGLRLRKPREHPHEFGAWHRGDLSDDVVRFGIALADGRKATVFDQRFPSDEPDAVLRPNGGGGGGMAWEFRFWAWPLPPDGPLAFVVEWPGEGIALTRAEIDSAPIREAAGRAQELWPAEPPTGTWTRYA